MGRIFFLNRLLGIFVLISLSAGAKTGKLPDIVTAVDENKILTKFSALIKASGQTEFLQSKGPFTIFAPVDSAFARFTPDQLQDFLNPLNQAEMQRVLLYHVINGKRMSGAELLTMNLLTCQGAPLTLKKNRLGTVLVQKAKIIRTDIRCKNGVIHQIDAVLEPPGPAIPPQEPPKAVSVDTNVVVPIPPTNGVPVAPATNTVPLTTNITSIPPGTNQVVMPPVSSGSVVLPVVTPLSPQPPPFTNASPVTNQSHP